jgi:Reverse transcriptase (RNA-dependent DNA polymerase)
MAEWGDYGEITSKPLGVIAADDPVSCAIYACDHNLLESDGWKHFRGIAKRQNKLLHMVNQAKLNSFRTAPRYKFGFKVPRDYNHAKELDKHNGNTKWMDATALELELLFDYATFEDLGHKAAPPPGYKRIQTHLIFDVKHDGCHKARMVADGHLTDAPIESIFSGVVLLRGIRTLIFIGELNGMEIWVTNVGNAYLEAATKEKIYFVAGAEFGELVGHTLVIVKALYGLRTSGFRWHERFADCLQEMGFFPSKAESDIWMRRSNNLYEYLGVYVDDLTIVSNDPQAIIAELADKYKF